MRFYRLHRRDNVDFGSAGFVWFTSLEAAQIAKMAWIEETGEDRAGGTKIDAIEITNTKAGLLAAFNAYASHADNG